MTAIRRLEQLTENDRASFGNKAWRLGQMAQAGIAVPAGFCIDESAFDPLDRDGILSAYRSLRGAVAVRSSSAAEDGGGLSFAGQFDSVLNVDGDDALLDALVRSAEAEDAIALDDTAGAEALAGLNLHAAPGEAGPAARAGARERAPRTIRLPLALIDQLMNGISDMVLARNDLARKMRDREADPDLESSFERLSANVADLRDMISKTRMQRVDRLYAARFPEEDRAAMGIGEGLVRMSVGLEHPDDLVADLAQALEAARTA